MKEEKAFGRNTVISGSVLLVAAALLTAVFLRAAPAEAGIYAYTDSQGRIHITNIPDRDEYELVIPDASTTRETGRSRPSTPPPSRGSRRDPHAFDSYIEEAANRYNLPESLIRAVIKVESNWNPYAVSSAGAQGLMQLMPFTARSVGCGSPFDPRENILGGSRYLRQQLDRFGRIDYALAAYNAGPEAVARYGGIPPYSETRSYVPRVLRYYRQYGGGTIASRGAFGPSTSSSENTRPGPPVVVENGAPFYAYRGPDGQIHLSNVPSESR